MIIVGSPLDDHPELSDAGSVYIFALMDGEWVEHAKLVGSAPQAGSLFGRSVAVSDPWLVIGADNFVTPTNTGAVHIYRRDGQDWGHHSMLLPGDAFGGAYLGHAVDIDGDVVIAGAYGDAHVDAQAGAAYVFRFNGEHWVQEEKLTASDASGFDQFGKSVAVQGDLVVIGAPQDNVNNIQAGSAYVFQYSSRGWDETQHLLHPQLWITSTLDEFGKSVAVQGTRIFIGAPRHNTLSQDDAGAIYMFGLINRSWDPQMKLHPHYLPGYGPSVYSEQLGGAVAIAEGVLISGSSTATALRIFDIDFQDCDNNGVPDRCDPDCNRNATPDSCEISNGASFDCDLNGMADECQHPADYVLDDGTVEVAYGVLPPGPGFDYIWLNQFTVSPGKEVITHIAVPWTYWMPEAGTATLLLYDDPDNNGDPNDATLIRAVDVATYTLEVLTISVDAIRTIYAIPPSFVGDAGDSFFVGVHISIDPGTYPALADVTPPFLQRSWKIVLPIGEPIPQALSIYGGGVVLHSSNWCIRALSLDCNGNGTWDQCDIDSGFSLDLNGNGIPDECDAPCTADISADGHVNVSDLLAVISNWGAGGGSPADINHDGLVDVADLLAVISSWGPCP